MKKSDSNFTIDDFRMGKNQNIQVNPKRYAKFGEFKPIDLLAVAAAREVHDGDVVFAGTGLPMLAIALAQLTTAPTAT